jgi:hypothetical protein
MATSGITSNIDAVKDALKIYGLVVRKDAHAETKKKIASVAYEAARFTPFGEKGALRAEISNLPNTKDGGRKRYGDSKYVGQYKLINWERKLRGLLPVGNSKFRKVKQYKIRPGAMSVEEKKSKDGTRCRATFGTSLRSNPLWMANTNLSSKQESDLSSLSVRLGAWRRLPLGGSPLVGETSGQPLCRGFLGWPMVAGRSSPSGQMSQNTQSSMVLVCMTQGGRSKGCNLPQNDPLETKSEPQRLLRTLSIKGWKQY